MDPLDRQTGCSVCGGKDLNLVDGYYYCVECGTQDVHVRETIVEQTVMGDGTFAHTTSKRITTVKEGIEMSSEWYKWHIYNFILVGLTDELIVLGAKPTFKMKVLWIWSRYVKKFQVKDDLRLKHSFGIEDDVKEQNVNKENEQEDSCNDDSDNDMKRLKSLKSKSDKVVRDMKTITKGIILTILYVALNLDRSDIQLSHLFRFIREGRLSLYDCMKFVPKELKMKAISNWKSFTLSVIEYNPISIRELSLTCFKLLKLGVPLVPDLRRLVKNFVLELCLPDDVTDLVFALMHFMPLDFLHIDAKMQKSLVRMPNYEGICMAYILVALKMCFGLDDDYEMRISSEIDKINDQENYLKSYKLGFLSEPSDRLFSFKEWCEHLKFRQYILCKNYLPIARQFNNPTDDFIFMEHLEKRRKREVKLSDDVTMDILNKIKTDQESQIISKSDFPVTLTPMSTYIDIIAQRVQDPELRLFLSEDFTKYSLRYSIKDLSLPSYFHDQGNPIVGVCELGKLFNKYVIGTLTVQEGDKTMVYVRNCQNKNWLKTEPPKRHHVTKVSQNENSSDKESDHGYDSNIENISPESDEINITISDESSYEDDKLLEIIDDIDDVSKPIFDDNFEDIQDLPFKDIQITVKEEKEDNCSEINTEFNLCLQDDKVNSLDETEHSQEREVSTIHFDPERFDRDKTIEELIKLACIKYKISIPKENTLKKQNKRKPDIENTKASPSEPKRKRPINRSKPGEAKEMVDNYISAYYNRLQNDLLNEVSQQVKMIIEKDNPNDINTLNDIDCQDRLNESSVINNQSDINNANVSNLVEGEIELPQAEIDTNSRVSENNLATIHSTEQQEDSVTVEETVEHETLHELFPISDPKFDEKEHDIRQLYVKLGKDLDMANVLISDISRDAEIDKIIEKQIVHFEIDSNIDNPTVANNKDNAATSESDNFSDSDNEVPLSILKESICFEREKQTRKNVKLEPFVRDPSSVKVFKYWVRHYKSVYVLKSRDIGKKFDIELNENLPASFVFVLRECAAVLGCSMFSLYKNMQNIEEILIANA